ncbi:reverse transcriptase domain-containing protein [Mucilaginibacter ginsenosidivorans]|uniref:Reverse transcriptase domain-containing protein n=1 Tax=Mucilaginibacter ginsenosidivorans TaxID=398053 RepID=A0A5B8US75_9SPHI|nr:reverse transcriptase domain-containing protein [Mucilaginibacter ginsenosidivorans]QEC61718.1 hypothetical protein FRZ54_03670 [Mucilaginibacter ginsenosidivorans]
MFVNEKSDTPREQDLIIEKPKWLKNRGYLHITPKINVNKKEREIISKVKSEKYVGNHAFFPLIHSTIKERKFKKHPENPTKRGHNYYHKGVYKQTAKLRPLHYATHIDALIFGYYGHRLLELYEKKLKSIDELSDCITAYRKVATEDNAEIGKSTINFAKEAFSEIEKRACSECVVLMFDIKSFFSELNHEKLKRAWCKLLDKDRLPKDHYNVFKASTQFKYILRDELRLKKSTNGKRAGFDERMLAKIRKEHGIEAFFENEKAFREAIKSKEIKVYKRQFVKNGVPVGIPQGLPLSAILANLYLLEFDKKVFDYVVEEHGGYYRRYSDDILIVCKPNQSDCIKKFIISEIEKSLVSISIEKTEIYLFKPFQISPNKSRIVSIQLLKDQCKIEKPLSYLGFEFYGNKTLIKSANIGKFYRRIIYSVKRKASRAKHIALVSKSQPVVFKGRLIKLYKRLDLDSNRDTLFKVKRLVKNRDGGFNYKSVELKPKAETEKDVKKSNYISYVNRAQRLTGDRRIYKQINKRRSIFNEALAKHLKKHY